MTGTEGLTAELKSCPFCGSKNIDARGWASENSAGPACDDCGAGAGSAIGSVEDNIAAWNRRAALSQPPSAQEAALEALTRERASLIETKREQIELLTNQRDYYIGRDKAGAEIEQELRAELERADLRLEAASKTALELSTRAEVAEAKLLTIQGALELIALGYENGQSFSGTNCRDIAQEALKAAQ